MDLKLAVPQGISSFVRRRRMMTASLFSLVGICAAIHAFPHSKQRA
jgi:hypothetical protein